MNGQLLHPPKNVRSDKPESPSSVGDSGVDVEENIPIARTLSQVRLKHHASSGPETPRVQSQERAPLLDGQDTAATEVGVWVRDEFDNDLAQIGAFGDMVFDRQSEMDPVKIPLPSQGSTELRKLNDREDELAVWRRFLELHRESVAHRVSAQEQRRHAEMLRADFTRNLQMLNLADSSTQERLSTLISLQDAIAEAEATINNTESQLVSREWEISELSADVVGPDGQGEEMFATLMEDGFALHGIEAPSPSEPSLQLTYYDDDTLDPDLDEQQVKISRKLHLIDVLENLSVDIHNQRAEILESAHHSPATAAIELYHREAAVRREIQIAHDGLDQLRAPGFVSTLSASPSEPVYVSDGFDTENFTFSDAIDDRRSVQSAVYPRNIT